MVNSPFTSESLIGSTYARISTAKQRDGISLDDQDARMNLYTTHNNIDVPDDYRFKEQVSGFQDERSEYDKIRQLVRERRINVLVIYGSDRHTRDPIHGDIFRAELRRNNVALHIITEGGEVDIITPTGQFLRRQMDNFNWYWGKMIQQTTQEKKRAYTEQGIPGQQGAARYGYRRVGRQGNAHFEIVEEIAATILSIFTWYAEGDSLGDICKRLVGVASPGDAMGYKRKQREHGIWNPSVIYDILNDETYAGVYYARRFKTIEDEHGNKKKIRTKKEEWIPVPVPAIISRELWDSAQKRLAEGQAHGNRAQSKYEYLLARLSKCRLERHDGTICGYAVRPQTPVNRPNLTGYYLCSSRMANVMRGKCTLPYFQVADCDAAVWNFTRKLLEDPQAMMATLRAAQEEMRRQQSTLYERIGELDDLITEHTREFDGLVRDYRQIKREKEKAGTFKPNDMLLATLQRQAEEISTAIEGLQGQKARLEAQLDQRTISDAEITALEEFAAEIQPKLPYATFQDKRDIIEALRFTFEFAYEEDRHVIYIMWHSYEFRVPVDEDSDPYRRHQNLPYILYRIELPCQSRKAA